MSEITKRTPKIISIDGVDGAGKNTISNMLREKLGKDGFKVAVVSPPFYGTNTGNAVKDYLMTGYGAIRDRRVASALYSVDRNMYYRDHFDELFVHPRYDYIIFNRNWLSNLLFQTTLEFQTEGDAQQFRHVATPGTNPDGAIYQMTVNGNTRYVGLAEMRDMLRRTPRETADALGTFYRSQRLAMVLHHMKFLYELEIAPWPIAFKDDIIVPFPKAYPMLNIVMSPHYDPELKESGAAICQRNLNTRYDNDPDKVDRNEKSATYLESVIENIHWMHRAFLDSLCPYDYSDASIADAATTLGIKSYYYKVDIPELHRLVDCFDYVTLTTTKYDHMNGGLVQNDVETNFNAALELLRTHDMIE